MLGNAGHLLWGEGVHPSERYSLIKIAGLLPLTVWAVRRGELTLRREKAGSGSISLWPIAPRRETLTGLGVGAVLSAPLVLHQALSRFPVVPTHRAWTAVLRPDALLFRLTISLPLTTVLLEELVFRGLLQRRFERAWSPSTSLLVTSLLFGLWHLVAGGRALVGSTRAGHPWSARVVAMAAPPVSTVLAGLAFGWLARCHRTLWAPLVAHWLAAAVLTVSAQRWGRSGRTPLLDQQSGSAPTASSD